MSRYRALATVFVGVVLMSTGCAAWTAAKVDPSPGSLVPNTTVGSHGSVFFVSDSVGWELTVPPDQLRTVVFRTADAGGHWQLWGIAPEPGTPVGFTASEVVLSYGSEVIRSSDGAHWSVLRVPGGGGTVTFLPDLQHGWIYGALPASLLVPTPAPGGKGGVPTGKGGGGKGGGGKGGAGNGGPPTGKGAFQTGIWSTTDGGATWRLLSRSTFGETNGTMSFWSPTTGMIAQGLRLLLTHDGGATWSVTRLKVPGVGANDQTNSYAPTMFDSKRGPSML